MQLPQAIQAYFEADRKNNCEALLACFAPSAAIHDEGRSHSGHGHRQLVGILESQVSARRRAARGPYRRAWNEGDRQGHR